MNTPNLKSNRIELIPMSLDYVNEKYLGWLLDSDVNRYLEVSKDIKIDDLRAYVKSKQNKNVMFWAIINESKEHIGNIKLDPVNYKHLTTTLGIMIGDKSSWGKGYAKESMRIVIDFVFNELNFRKINLGVVKNNQEALNLYLKLGFKIEGTLEKQGIYDDNYCDTVLMALFKEE